MAITALWQQETTPTPRIDGFATKQPTEDVLSILRDITWKCTKWPHHGPVHRSVDMKVVVDRTTHRSLNHAKQFMTITFLPPLACMKDYHRKQLRLHSPGHTQPNHVPPNQGGGGRRSEHSWWVLHYVGISIGGHHTALEGRRCRIYNTWARLISYFFGR